MNEAYNIDCMEFMRRVPSKYFDLAVVDPPYGIEKGFKETSRVRRYGQTKTANDDKPTAEYFTELFRVSKNQIIWGYNHLSDLLPPTKEFIFWYKRQPVDSYSDGELAWTSFNKTAKCFDHAYFGNVGADDVRIHPMQKPVALYLWLYTKYARPYDKIFDSHLGSGSSRIAAYDMALDFIGCEIDADYFQKQEQRFEEHTAQQRLYQCVEDNNIAWHCGTSGAYVHPRCRNENSIGIEVRPYKLDKSTARSAAPADWYFPPEIVDNLVVFTQMLMQKYNVPLENVVRHYDVTGKWCPRPWMGDDTNTYYGTSGNEQWKKFKERLSGEELDMNIEEARKQLTSCADTGDTPSEWARDAAEFCKRKGIFNGDGAGNYGWQQPITREAVAQILYNAFESAGMLDAIPDKK